jgi:hypothetical protein
MKKAFILFLLLLVAVGSWILLSKQPALVNRQRRLKPIVLTNEVAALPNSPTSLPQSTNPSPAKVIQTSNEWPFKNQMTPELVLTNYANLKDLKQIRGLKQLTGYSNLRAWLSEDQLLQFQITGRDQKSVGLKVILFTALTDNSDDHVRQLTLNSSWLDIDQVRQIGLQLEDAWGLDPVDFLAWCDKVGNKWLDAPLFNSRNGIAPFPNQYIGFGVHRTTNDKNPWIIIVSIEDKI